MADHIVERGGFDIPFDQANQTPYSPLPERPLHGAKAIRPNIGRWTEFPAALHVAKNGPPAARNPNVPDVP